MDESDYIEGIDQAVDLLEKYNVQDWDEDNSSEKEAGSTDNGVDWS